MTRSRTQPAGPPPGPPGPPAGGKDPAPPRGGTLPLASPLDQEAIASWIEGLYSSYPAQIQREAAWLSSHPDDADARGRILWLRHALSVSRYLAYTIRTSKLRKEV